VRCISGNVLTGTSIGTEGYLGFYDQQVTVIPEGDYYEFLGWALPTINKLSFSRALGLFSFLAPNKEFKLDSNTHGEPRAFVETGVFERVTPMDIYPVQLLKAILANDIDEMEALGIYEVIEEDFALCEFVDVSKHHVQKILRDGLDMMQTS
jgi:Na+-transporting NADH:ubiquinone oxidoreductase subunit A